MGVSSAGGVERIAPSAGLPVAGMLQGHTYATVESTSLPACSRCAPGSPLCMLLTPYSRAAHAEPGYVL